MIRNQIELEIRKGFQIVLIFALQVLFVLLWPKVLRQVDLLGMVVALQFGYGVGFFLFGDPDHTEPFVFSRPFTRRRLFWIRWLTGIGILAAGLTICALLIASGLREAIQHQSRLRGLYPMIRFQELRVLWSLGLSSLLAFGLTVVLKLRHQYVTRSGESALLGTLGTFLSLAVALSMLFIFGAWLNSSGVPRYANLIALTYLALITALMTLTARNYFEQTEIES